MLNLRQVKHLAKALGRTVEQLNRVADGADGYCKELWLVDPARPDKRRDVVDVRGELRILQDRLLRRILTPRLPQSKYSHGGIAGRSIKTNAGVHARSAFVYTADIQNFFPTISRNRVYDLFTGQLECSPNVARLCTRICTHQHHLALGLVTSPFLAELIVAPVDKRIARACAGLGLKYSRFVDDLAISGPFDLKQSGLPRVIETILHGAGFVLHPEKQVFGSLTEDTPITKIVVRNGRVDAHPRFVERLHRDLADLALLAQGHPLAGVYHTRTQMLGKIRFVSWLNRYRKRPLMAKYDALDWSHIEAEASRHGYVQMKPKLVART